MAEPDFRTDRSDSVEGKGRARRAWDAYVRTVNDRAAPVLGAAIEPAAAVAARTVVEDSIGFWVLWHLYGGFEGLQQFGYHRATIFRKVKRFRMLFGAHPDEYDFPGITLDPKAHWEAKQIIGPRPS